MKKIFFHELAKKELLDYRDNYDELVRGLGKSFLIEIERCINIIKTNPKAFPKIQSKIRKAVILKFPFSVLYKEEEDRTVVLAVMHQKRKPKYWSERSRI